MTRLAALALAALLLTGCGKPVALAPAPTARAAQAASTGLEHTLLYGAVIEKGTVKAVKRPAPGDGSRGSVLLSILVTKGHAIGKVDVRFWQADDARTNFRVGDVVAGFISYPTVNLKTGKFVNVPGREASSLGGGNGLKVIKRQG